MMISQETLLLLFCGIIGLFCLFQWVVIKIYLYEKMHFTELNWNPNKLSEKEKIRQSSLALFFIPLIIVALFLRTTDITEIIFFIGCFAILFALFYKFINEKLK